MSILREVDILQDYKKLYLNKLEIITNNKLGGWFVGCFEPNLIKREDIEVGIKKIPSNTNPDYHYHKIKTEYTILLEGKIVCVKDNIEVEAGSIIKLLPYEKNDQFFPIESLILVINTPSIQGDKYI